MPAGPLGVTWPQAKGPPGSGGHVNNGPENVISGHGPSHIKSTQSIWMYGSSRRPETNTPVFRVVRVVMRIILPLHQPKKSISIGLSLTGHCPQFNGKIKGYWSADDTNL